MARASVLDAIRRLGLPWRIAIVSALLAVSFAMSVASVTLLPPSAQISAWWPAAGVNIIVVLAVPKRLRYLLAVLAGAVTLAALLVAGRPLLGASIFALGTIAEVLLVKLIVTRGGERARLDDLRDVNRFVLAAVAGGIAIGLVGGLAAVLAIGADFWLVVFSVGVSHASAILVIAPLAVARPPLASAGSLWGRVLHFGVLVAVVAAVFWPGNTLPIAFIAFPLVAWGALRYGMYYVSLEVLATTLLAGALSAVGGGPFASIGAGPTVAAGLFETFLVAFGATALYLAAARFEGERLTERQSARAQLLTEGVVAARNGFAIVQDVDRRMAVIETNAAARHLLPGQIVPVDEDPTAAGALDAPDEVPSDARLYELLSALLDTGEREVSEEWGGEGGLEVSLHVTQHPGATEGHLFTVEATDVSDQREQARNLVWLIEQERDVAEGLRELNEQKDTFVSAVNHELRTPITSILGFADALEDSELDDEQRAELAIIVRNASRLAELVDDLLALSRIGAARDGDRPTEPVSPDGLLADSAADLTVFAQSRGVRIELELAAEGRTVTAYPNDLTRVFTNLMSNAIKFSPTGGSVRVSTRQAGLGSVRIEIADSGPGIAPEDLERVFERFYRTRRAVESQVKGTGLGLPIVRAVVEKLGGAVHLESDGSSGTTAVVELPLDAGRPLDAEPGGASAPPH